MPTSELRTYQGPPTHRLCATHSTATDPLQYHLLSAQIAVPAVPHASHVGTGVAGRRTCCDSAQQPCVRFTSAGRGRADVDPNGCGPPIAAPRPCGATGSTTSHPNLPQGDGSTPTRCLVHNKRRARWARVAARVAVHKGACPQEAARLVRTYMCAKDLRGLLRTTPS
jgi:hypothetical protein